MQVKIVLISTNNSGKVAELTSLLADLPGLELATPASLGLNLEVEETGRDYAENAGLKAKTFAEASGLPAMADDSGLEVAVLNGAPGVLSNRYGPGPKATDAERRAYLMAQLQGLLQPWKARFRCALCLALPSGEVYFAEGECQGEIIPEERGSGGFGYDAVFLVEGCGQTMAELSMDEKNRVSHRALAVQGIKPILRRQTS